MNKQIEKILYDISCIEKMCNQYCNERRCRECRLYFLHTDCENQLMAEGLFLKGYRRQDEVAREIFAELKTVMIDEYRYPIIAELKEKYGVTES